MATKCFAVMNQWEVIDLNSRGKTTIPSMRCFSSVSDAQNHLASILWQEWDYATKKERAVVSAEYSDIYTWWPYSDYDLTSVIIKKPTGIVKLIVDSAMKALKDMFWAKSLIKADNDNQLTNFWEQNDLP